MEEIYLTLRRQRAPDIDTLCPRLKDEVMKDHAGPEADGAPVSGPGSRRSSSSGTGTGTWGWGQVREGGATAIRGAYILAKLSWSRKYQATFDCLMKTYGFLTPDFWTETRFRKSPFQEFTDLLAKPIAATKAILPEEAERLEA
ncbi:uncharacterized protein A4U43_C07F37280 [Asparagus officinalis]|uniref:Uncharacterized protein n=1 Tax=Asparagus officinalis TaxID=4686 RepID=A0A5P1EI52_ASPOF|nr:uncharacterized protein A4U43_C07F37280 [Asparagus officinalis]